MRRIFFLIIVFLFIQPHVLSAQSEFVYPLTDGCTTVSALFDDLKANNVSLSTFREYFSLYSEAEVALEFQKCNQENITEGCCQKYIHNQIGDTSLALLKIRDIFHLTQSMTLNTCKLVKDSNRSCYYLIQTDTEKTIVQIDKKSAGISDFINREGKSLIYPDLTSPFFKELVREFIGD